MSNFRFEFKYIVSPSTAYRLEEFIRQRGMVLDNSAENGTYPVLSLYFDSPNLSDYYDKSGGFISRKKLRARVYADAFLPEAKDIWLEIKYRHNAVVGKIRSTISFSQYKDLLMGKIFSAWTAVHQDKKDYYLNEIFKELAQGRRRPSVLVRYTRKAFVSYNCAEKLRITFDSKLEASKNHQFILDLAACKNAEILYYSGYIPIEPHRVIFEVKFKNHPPYWLGQAVRLFELERTSISKYARALEGVRFYQPMPR